MRYNLVSFTLKTRTFVIHVSTHASYSITSNGYKRWMRPNYISSRWVLAKLKISHGMHYRRLTRYQCTCPKTKILLLVYSDYSCAIIPLRSVRLSILFREEEKRAATVGCVRARRINMCALGGFFWLASSCCHRNGIILTVLASIFIF